MKKILVLLPLLFAALMARADLIVEQQMESAMMNGTVTYKNKGDRARMDMPGGPAGALSTIIDTGKGEVSTILHGQKRVMKMNLKDTQAAVAAMKAKKDPSLDSANLPAPKPTGQKEKVGPWDTEIYTNAVPPTTMKMWVAKDFPNAAAIKARMNKISEVTAGARYNPKATDVPGMIVKTQVDTVQGSMTITLTGVREETVPESDFAIPADYTEMQFPSAKAPPLHSPALG